MLLEGTSRPVTVKSESLGTQVLRSVGDAARIFGIDIDVVIHAANGRVTVSTRCGDITFSWPSVADASDRWPAARVVQNQPIAAHPCTIHYKTPGKHGRRYDMDVRSIRATRLHLGLGETDFERVVHKLPGWRQVCPPCVVGITKHAPGYLYVNPILAPGDNHEFFTLAQLKSSVRVEMTAGCPQYFADLRDIPDFVLNNGRWR